MNTQRLVQSLENTLSGVFGKNSADNELLTVAFTSQSITLLHLELGVPRPKILRYSVIRQDASTSESERKTSIVDFLSSLKNKRFPDVAVTWSDGMTFRQLNMPKMPIEDLEKAFFWDLKKKYYYNQDENYFGYSEVMSVEGAESAEKLYNVYYCDKKSAAIWLSFVQNLGLEIRSLVPGQASLACFVAEAEPTPESDVLICELEDGLLRILVVRENHNMMVRQVVLGAAEPHLTDEILTKITDEIKKTIDFYESQKYFRPVEKVVMVSDAGDMERVHQFMTQHLDTKVVPLNIEPFLSSALKPDQKNYLINHPSVVASGLGAALLGDGRINLVPEEIKKKNRQRRSNKLLNFSLFGLGFLLFLVVVGATLHSDTLKAKLDIFKKQSQEIDEKKKSFESILYKEKARRRLFKGEIYFPSLLKELSYRTPTPITLTDIDYSAQAGNLTLRGQISDVTRESAKNVTQYATNLTDSPFIASAAVTSSYQDEEKKLLQFEIVCDVKALL